MSREKGASELDKSAHRIHDFATGKSEGWYETDDNNRIFIETNAPGQ